MKPRTSLSRRALLLLGIQALLLLVVIGSAFIQLRRVEEAQILRLNEDSRTLLTYPRITALLHDVAHLAHLRTLAASPEEASRQDAEFLTLPTRFSAEVSQLRTAIPEHSRALSEMDAAFRLLVRIGDDARFAARQRQFPRSQALMRTEFQPRWQRLSQFLSALADRTRLDLQRRATETAALTHPIVRRTVVGALIVLAAGLLAAHLWIWRTITSPLQALGRAADRLAAGDLGVHLPGDARTDEIGTLANALSKVAQRATTTPAPTPTPTATPAPAPVAPPACSEPEWQCLVEAAPDAMVVIDAAQHIISLNRQTERLFGYSRDQLVGQPSHVLVPERFHAEYETSLARLAALARQLPGTVVEGVARRRDGTEFPVEFAVAPIETPSRSGLLCASLRDISEHRRIETELEDLVAFQRALIDSIPYPVFVKDVHARFLGCNTAYEQAFQTSADTLRGRMVTDLTYLPTAQRERFHAEDLETLRTRERRSYELPIAFADGRDRVTLYTVDAFSLADGSTGGLIGMLVDITDRKTAEEELRRQQRLLQNLIDNAEAFVFVKDLEGRYLLVNQHYVRLLKRPASDLLGRTLHDLFPSEAADAFELGESDVLASARPLITETVASVDGQTRTFLAHKFPLFDSDGKLFALGGISTDVSAIKDSQRELAQARDDAEAANRAKSAFVATMSHEIRTPMNAILNLTALALDTQLTPRQRQYVAVAHSSARGLLALLNDILDFSKIEAGRLDLEAAPFLLRGLLEEVADSFRGRVLETRIDFGVLVADDVPDALLGDTLRLRQVLTNLLGNAFKFTERGQIVVRVESTHPEPAPGTVGLRFSVADTGIGIPAEKRARLFEAFSQADSSTSRKYGGTGLGLVISQRLVRLMRGELQVTSEPGRGSDFHFTVPFTLAPPPPEPVTTPSVSAGLLHTRALVVEDSDLSRELLVTMLQRFGLAADGVATAELGLTRLRQALTETPYGLVVLDWLLPDLNGVELTRRIRSVPELAQLPIVMVSAYATEQEEAAAQAAGIQAFVPKPITGSLLLDAVTRATGLRPEVTPPQGPAESTPSFLSGRRLLVAEDNDANQFVVRELLQREGAQVEIAENGEIAVAKVQSTTYDLVLMDMQMPVMDGLEATRRIRSLAAQGSLPIVALTANAMKSDLDACLAAGMNDYVAKPIDRASLLSVLARNLLPHEVHAPIPAPTPTVPLAPAQIAAPLPVPEPPAPTSTAPPAPAPKEPETETPPTPHEDTATALAAETPHSLSISLSAAPEAPAPTAPVTESTPHTEPATEPEAAKPRPAKRKRATREKQLDLLEIPTPIAATEADLRERVAAGKLPGIDVEDALQRLGLPRPIIETMLLQFRSGQHDTVAKLRAALADSDADEARRIAHSLAGAAGNLSMHELRRLAKTVELAIKFQQGDLTAMNADLEREMNRVLSGLGMLAELRGATPPEETPPVAPGTGEPAQPAVPPKPAPVAPETLRHLEKLALGLDDGDLDAISTHFPEVDAALRGSHDKQLGQIKDLVDAFEHLEAARLVRRLSAELKPRDSAS
ncbi:MAG: response regulator [Verrucomicrobiales bacterium]|nr:response regulator [Verrucomicrobiales bacterium]